MMSKEKTFLFWSLVLCGIMGFVFIFNAILLPFVLGGGIAYLLNPLLESVARLRVWKAPIGRYKAVFLILGLFFASVFTFLGFLVPVVYFQILEFMRDAPMYYGSLKESLAPFIKEYSLGLDPQGLDLAGTAQTYMGSVTNVAGSILSSVFLGGQAFFHLFSLIVFTPVVAYFVMQEWAGLCAWCTDILPRQHKAVILSLIAQMDEKISAFVRGQITVAVILGVSYALALAIVGLKYGVLIGILAGVFSVIPFVGPLVGGLVSVGVAWFQSGDWAYVALVGGVFVMGQIIEGNILTPNLVGKSVGLHPLWLFFALMAGGALFGFLGLFLAVPVAAVLSVLAKFSISRYKSSRYYAFCEPEGL